jgi:hypothetical protein
MIMNLTSRVALVVAALITLNNAPVQAQEFSMSQPEAPAAAPQDPLSQVPADIRAKMQPGVRYTVGAKVTQGWEQTLTKGNHNLGHFYWSPMVNYVQATPSRKTGSQAVAAEPEQQPREQFHYMKPRTAPLACNPAARASAWKKPAVQKVILRSSRPEVSAKIAYNKRDVSASLIARPARPTEAKAYRSYNSDQYASGSLSSKDAYGQIIGR